MSETNVTSIDSAATAAAEALANNAGASKSEETKTEKVEETKSPEKTETELKTQKAVAFWDALNDPTKAGDIVRLLAEKNGYTKAEVKEVKEAIEDEDFTALKAALGDDFEDFAKKLAPALKSIVKKAVDRETSPLKSESETAKQKELATEATQAISDLCKETFNTNKLTAEQETALGKLIDKYKPSKGMTPKEYLSDLFNLLPGTKSSARVENNRNDVGSRLSSEAGGKTEQAQVPASSKPMSIDEAARAAAEQISKKG